MSCALPVQPASQRVAALSPQKDLHLRASCIPVHAAVTAFTNSGGTSCLLQGNFTLDVFQLILGLSMLQCGMLDHFSDALCCAFILWHGMVSALPNPMQSSRRKQAHWLCGGYLHSGPCRCSKGPMPQVRSASQALGERRERQRP